MLKKNIKMEEKNHIKTNVHKLQKPFQIELNNIHVDLTYIL